MALFFSPSTSGFYSTDLHDSFPEDTIRITPARHRALLDGQASGAMIVTGPDGHPRLQRPAAPTLAQKRARKVQAARREASRRIEAVSPLWRQCNDLRAPSPAGDARFAAIDAIRAASDAMHQQIDRMTASELEMLDIGTHPSWPSEEEA